MAFLEPVTLQGAHARLEPLSHDHIDGLVEAVSDGELWKLWYTFIPTAENMKKEIDRRLGLFAAGSMLPFTVYDAEGKIAGMTTYMNVDAANRRVEIGSTWYAKRVQRSALNTQCKLLLLTHAFEKLNCIAVEFRTHFFNHQSRRGIERLGAKQDGILRKPPDRAERHVARHRGLQHHRQRMADGEGASHLSTQRKAAVTKPRQKRDDGNVRLCDYRRGLRRQRARQPAQRRSCEPRLCAGSGADGLAPLHSSAGRLHQDVPHEERQLGLQPGAGPMDRRPQHLRAARQDAGRIVVDQRPHLQPRPAPGFRHLGAARQSRLGLSGHTALFQAAGAAGRRGRRDLSRARRQPDRHHHGLATIRCARPSWKAP